MDIKALFWNEMSSNCKDGREEKWRERVQCHVKRTPLTLFLIDWLIGLFLLYSAHDAATGRTSGILSSIPTIGRHCSVLHNAQTVPETHTGRLYHEWSGSGVGLIVRLHLASTMRLHVTIPLLLHTPSTRDSHFKNKCFNSRTETAFSTVTPIFDTIAKVLRQWRRR